MPRTYKLSALAGSLALVGAAMAQTTTPPATPPPATPAPSGPPAPTTPAMVGSLTANSAPATIDGGPLGKVFVTGVLSGLAQWQDKPAPGDHGFVFDISNGQVFVQTTAGKIQFFLQAGSYSLPALGTPYLHADDTTRQFYGVFPQGYVKFAPTDSFSLEVGKLPTLIGAECTFTVENFNIDRGLLWNQENAVNRGVQANYSKGPLTLAASWNDGFYSNQFSWIWASATDVINPRDTIAVIGGGNTRHTFTATAATPLFLNNESIYNVILTHTAGQWVIQPYLQYTSIPKIAAIGAGDSSSTTGAALLASYAFSSKSKLAGATVPFRLEYIKSTGSAASPNLLYGQGSNAWSVSITPTYQYKSFFARAELSYVTAGSITAGAAFGADGKGKTQSRLSLETGLLF